MKVFDPIEAIHIFDSYGFDGRSFYIMTFGAIPHSVKIEDVDVHRLYQFIEVAYRLSSLGEFKDHAFDWSTQSLKLTRAIMILQNVILVELKESTFTLFFRSNQREAAQALVTEITTVTQNSRV